MRKPFLIGWGFKKITIAFPMSNDRYVLRVETESGRVLRSDNPTQLYNCLPQGFFRKAAEVRALNPNPSSAV